jgi:hypothetical protein
MRFRVAPHPASSSCTGDGSSSFLESRILWRSLPSESPGCPESPLLQSRLPMSLRVAPNPASSGCADGESPGCPESSLPQRTGWWISGLPRLSHLPAFPALNLRVAPNLHLFQRRLLLIFGLPRFSTPSATLSMDPQVSPVLASSGCTVSASSGFPESCFYGWVDDDSPAQLELCILG